ncbi:MAG: pyruvate synthase subunit beta, partial [Candidatus Cloacimonetes bacterium]|nr:pyruvate synthase subunit beta [Candidatus Cloacimonadota bacterium]
MRLTIPEQEIMKPGHLACQGCGATMAMRYGLKVFGRNTVLTIPACCWAVIDGPFPYTAVNVPLFHTAFETAAIMASGIKAGFDALGKTSTNVVAWAGDGGTFDIGMAAISGAAERNDDITYIVYDNEAYMN